MNYFILFLILKSVFLVRCLFLNNTEQGTPNDDLRSILSNEQLKTRQYD
jgi:hypothetical protein